MHALGTNSDLKTVCCAYSAECIELLLCTMYYAMYTAYGTGVTLTVVKVLEISIEASSVRLQLLHIACRSSRYSGLFSTADMGIDSSHLHTVPNQC